MRAVVDEVTIIKINEIRLARQTLKEEFVTSQELLASHPPHLPPPQRNFPVGFASAASNQYGAMGAMLIALQSTGVFAEDYLVGNSQTKEGFHHGQLGQAIQQFFTQAAATPARARPLLIDSNPIANKAEVAGKSAKPNKKTRRELNLPNAFMGNILDLLQQDQEGASVPSPLAKHFSTNTAKWTTCVNCTCTWIEPEPQRCHIKLTVPAAPSLGPHDAPINDVPLTDMFSEWTRGVLRRGEICPVCDQRSGTEDMQQFTEVQDVVCIALDRYPRQQCANEKQASTTTTSVALPMSYLDLGKFFHPDFHHEEGVQLFQLCAVVCHDDGCSTPGPSFRLARFTTYAEHPACGGWFRHDLNTATLVNLPEALTSEEIRTRSVAAVYRRHEPSSPRSEDRREGTPVDPHSPAGMWRADEPVGMPQVRPRPVPEKHRSPRVPMYTAAEADIAAAKSAKQLAEENRTADAKKGQRTAKPKAQAPAAPVVVVVVATAGAVGAVAAAATMARVEAGVVMTAMELGAVAWMAKLLRRAIRRGRYCSSAED